MDRAELELVATARRREPGRLDSIGVEAPPDPSIAELLALLPRAPSQVWLGGGEPTLRADLPELVAAVSHAGHEAGLCTDALALASEGALEPLASAGLRRVRVTLHAARGDAHDWLVGMPGAAKRAVRAMGRLRARGIELEISATVTRPTLPLLGELVEAAASLGAQSVRLSRLVLQGPVRERAIALAPRHALGAPYLEHAVRVGQRVGVRVVLLGFPECATGNASSARAPDAPRPLTVVSSAWSAHARALAQEALPGCARCPGPPRCEGAPADYVARFGRDEIDQGAPAQLAEVIRFRFRGPSRVACAACGDAELDGELESTRSIRTRLVRAAQQGARTLRIVGAGSLAHPEAAALLREATLLSFERVEVAGEASALDEASDAALYPLSGLTRFDVALYGPDAESHDAHMGRPGAFAAALRVAERIRSLASVETGSYAVLHDAAHLAGFARAWAEGRLPGAPRFRLSSRGGSLATLEAAVLDEPARRALSSSLPTCLFDPGSGREPPGRELGFEDALIDGSPRSGSDPDGDYEPCACGGELAARCRGLARGWRLGIG